MQVLRIYFGPISTISSLLRVSWDKSGLTWHFSVSPFIIFLLQATNACSPNIFWSHFNYFWLQRVNFCLQLQGWTSLHISPADTPLCHHSSSCCRFHNAHFPDIYIPTRLFLGRPSVSKLESASSWIVLPGFTALCQRLWPPSTLVLTSHLNLPLF